MPCKGGYRDRIEAGKRRKEEQQIYQRSSERLYWLDLVNRVHHTSAGLAQLRPAEKTYFAVCCLIGEVCNGGLSQFFFNSSGAMYGLALDGLLELEANDTAALLERAKTLLFGVAIVPVDTESRRQVLANTEESPELDELDRDFWKSSECLAEKCKSFALRHALYRDA